MVQTLNESISFQWHITDFCNLRCKHCYQDNFTDENDLSIDKINLILENLSVQFRKISINITGGEPFLRKDFYEILNIIEKSVNVSIFNIITNGTLLNYANIEKLKSFKKLNELKISIDGILKNDLIRGKGILEIVKKNILKIYDLKKVIMFTAGSFNYLDIEDVFEFAREYANGLIIERFVPLGNGLNLKNCYLKKNEWKYIVEYIKDCFMIDDINELAKYRAFYIDFDNNEFLGALCNLGESFAIMSDGTIYPCRRLPINLGNALTETQILQKIIMFRNMLEEKLEIKCKECIYFNECIGCRAGVYATKNDLFAFDEQCII